ncbi:hypothetical protein AGDE_13840 [Angomonas deanei]|nr:hypothetical protein AGDE_13840 [Angomonas deanei]|eukprot:EPY21712.1 hypothetical protein AGDE_13840 [Angomonas deanei]
MVKHHSYQIAPRQAYTNSYVMRTVDAAVEMAFAVLEDLQRHPIDEELKTALGTEDGAVLLSCMVHWCTEATVLVGSGGKSYLYEGADLDLGSRLWLHASPGVTLSGAAKQHCLRSSFYTITHCNTVLERRGGAPQDLFLVDNVNNRWLVQCKQEGEKHLPPIEEGANFDTSESGTISRKSSTMGDIIYGTSEGMVIVPGFESTKGEDGPLGRHSATDSLVQGKRSSSSASVPTSAVEGDEVTRQILNPVIPIYVDKALSKAFDHQATMLDTEYGTVRVIMYYFFASFKLLFQPLAAPERANIYHRLISAFGVPQQNILEHLAARCTLRYIQQNEGNTTSERQSTSTQ